MTSSERYEARFRSVREKIAKVEEIQRARPDLVRPWTMLLRIEELLDSELAWYGPGKINLVAASAARECPSCHGDGRSPLRHPQREESCPDCGGSGFVRDEVVMDTYHGGTCVQARPAPAPTKVEPLRLSSEQPDGRNP